MDLTNDDVADILALLDSLPYDSLDLRTDKFRLTLRRAPSGGWTEESELLTQPTTIIPAPPAADTPASLQTTTAPRASSAPGSNRSGESGGGAKAVGGGGGGGGGGGTGGGNGTGGGGETGTGNGTRGGDGTGGGDGTKGGDGTGGGDETGGGGGENAGGTNADGLVAVVAPLPGTFYRAPRPGAPPFVEIGDVVGADTVIAIIETMKLMNSVHAGTPGRVARILVGNGEFAPVGAALLLIQQVTRAPIDPDARLPIDPDS